MGRSSVIFLLTLNRLLSTGVPIVWQLVSVKKDNIGQSRNFGTEVYPHYRIAWNSEFDILSRNLEVDGCPSKENLFEQSALLMNAIYINFP